MNSTQADKMRIADLSQLLNEVKKGLCLNFTVHGYTRADQIEQDITFLKQELANELARQGANDGELRYREM